MVVCNDVEEGNDLVDITIDDTPGFAFADPVLGSVARHCIAYHRIFEQLPADVRASRELIPIDARTRPV